MNRITRSACTALATIVGAALIATTGGTAAASSGPVVVGSPSEVPAGAVEDTPSQYATDNPCDTTRSWTLTTPGTAETFRTEYRHKRTVPAQAEVREYTFDKYVQRQKAKWSGHTYVGPISSGYPGSYTWRDAGFAPVTNTTGVKPTAPGPVRGEFIHNSGGTWYFTLFYEYRKISERVIQTAQPAYTEFYVSGGAPTRDKALASWVPQSTITGWTQFESRQVSNNDATAPVVTTYVWSDGKVCETPPPVPPTTPEPPTVPPVPPVPPILTIAPQVDIDTRCTGRTHFTADNTRSEKSVLFKMKAKRHGKVVWSKTIRVKAGDERTFVKRLPNRAKAIITTIGDRAKIRVPAPCPTPPPVNPPTGAKAA